MTTSGLPLITPQCRFNTLSNTLRDMKNLWLIGGLGLASILGSCDEGKIYPSETGSGNEGFSVVMTGNVVGSSDYGSG